jgi:hypothetical protein
MFTSIMADLSGLFTRSFDGISLNRTNSNDSVYSFALDVHSPCKGVGNTMDKLMRYLADCDYDLFCDLVRNHLIRNQNIWNHYILHFDGFRYSLHKIFVFQMFFVYGIHFLQSFIEQGVYKMNYLNYKI